MTLVALLLLCPTPSLHPWGPGDTIPGDHVLTRAAAPVIGDLRSVFIAGDPAGAAGCAEGEWCDDEGADTLLGQSPLPRPCRHDDRPSRPRSLASRSSPSVCSRHLRC
jgi:hypothetical protein